MRPKKKKKKIKIRYALLQLDTIDYVYEFQEAWVRAEAATSYHLLNIDQAEAASLVADYPDRGWTSVRQKGTRRFCVSSPERIEAQKKIDKARAERKAADAVSLPSSPTARKFVVAALSGLFASGQDYYKH